MVAWVRHTDPLLISIDQSYAGLNYKDNRTVWHDLNDIVLSDGGLMGAVWYKDFGPKANPDNVLEPRAYCIKGQLDFLFSGITLIIRINVAFSWYTGAVVLIDGVPPSTLGLLTAVDTLSCDSATYQLTGDGYLDVIVADGLPDDIHTCTIIIDSPDPAKFFSLSGFKVGSLVSQPINRLDGWLIPTEDLLPQNLTTITISNLSDNSVVVPTMSFPPELVDDMGAPLGDLTSSVMAPGDTLTQVVLPVFAGTELSQIFSYDLGMVAEYVDPDGLIPHTVTTTALVGNVALVVSGLWFSDHATNTGQARLFTTTYATAKIAFTFSGDALTLTIQQAFTWGEIGIYDEDDVTLLGTADCNGPIEIVVQQTITGFGAGDHNVILRKTTNDSAFIVFVAASWLVDLLFTEITEAITLTYEANQPVAMPVLGVVIGDYDATFDVPIPDTFDFSGIPVRENTDLVYTEVLTRFPTFCVFYQRGELDILSQYDIVIIDPLAATVADVSALQAKGIKVFGYISMGEETGFYENRYDFSSPQAPNVGDGLGPGGTAGYYMYTRNPITGPPDNDGVWAAYYTNPDPGFGWPARLESYYAPQVLGGPVTITEEVVTVLAAVITAGPVLVFNTAESPVDGDQTITLTTLDGMTTYVTFRDYTFDVKTGAFVLSTTISPPVIEGQQLKISYIRKGHFCDGVFLDTMDTPDVYGSDAYGYVYVPGYAEAFAAMANTFHDNHPDAWLISNRGFTILPSVIAACKGVMFESWLTFPEDINNLATTNYFRITDPDTVAANEAFNTLLRDLRLTHEFDVLSLNYCQPEDTDLRDYCRTKDAEMGYMSWQTTILLNEPGPNQLVNLPGLPLSTVFTQYKRKAV